MDTLVMVVLVVLRWHQTVSGEIYADGGGRIWWNQRTGGGGGGAGGPGWVIMVKTVVLVLL